MSRRYRGQIACCQSAEVERAEAQKEMTMATTPRRPSNPIDAPEALFKPAKKTVTPASERPAIPNTMELVSLQIDSDIRYVSRQMAQAGRSVSMTPFELR
jgi:uncharacterized protein (DUF4415 family)